MSNLATLNAATAIVDVKGRPTLAFQKQYQTAIEGLRSQVTGLEEALAGIIAAQAAADTAQAAAVAAQAAAADVQTAVDEAVAELEIVDLRTEPTRDFLSIP